MRTLTINYDYGNALEQEHASRSLSEQAAGFDRSWNRLLERDLANFREGREFAHELADPQYYGLPQGLDNEAFAGVLRAYYLMHGMTEDQITVNSYDNETAKWRLNAQFVQELYMEPELLQKSPADMNDAERNRYFTRMANRVQFFSALAGRIPNLEIPLPNPEGIDPAAFIGDARRTRLFDQIGRAAEYAAHIRQLGYTSIENSGSFPHNGTAQRAAALYSGLLHVFAQPVFAGDGERENLLDAQEVRLLHCYSQYVDQENLPDSVTLGNEEDAGRLRRVLEPQQEVAVPPQHEVLRHLLGERRRDRTYMDLDDFEFLNYITRREVHDERTARRSLSYIYINGQPLEGMALAEAVEAIKNSLDVDSLDVVTVRRRPVGNRRTADREEAWTDEYRIVEPEYPVSRSGRTAFTYAGEENAAQNRKIARDQEFLRQLMAFDPDRESDVRFFRAPEYARERSAQTAQNRIRDARFLAELSGRAIPQLNDSAGILNAVENIYINGVCLPDVIGAPPSADNIEAYADAVKKALEGDGTSFVTVMNHASLMPLPRAVIPRGDKGEPRIRRQINASVGYVMKYREQMFHALAAAKERAEQADAANLALFVPQGTQEPLVGSRSSFALPALYMMSLGYSREEVFGNDPRLRQEKARIGREFYELISPRQDAQGNALPADDQQNREHYAKHIEPVLKKMAETLSLMSGIETDISRKENLSVLCSLRQFYVAASEFCGEMKKSPFTQELCGLTDRLSGPVRFFEKKTALQLAAMESRLYQSDGRERDLSDSAEAYFYEVFQREFEKYQPMHGVPFGAFPLSSGQLDRLDACLEKESRENPYWAEEFEKYGLGKPNKVAGRLAGPDMDPAMAEIWLELQAAAEEKNPPAAGDVWRRTLMDACPSDARDGMALTWEKFYDCRKDEGTMLLSVIAGFPVGVNSTPAEIDAALEKIYINDKSLKEYFHADEGTDFQGLKAINQELKSLLDESLRGRGGSCILRKGPGSAFKPVYLDYSELREPSEVVLNPLPAGADADPAAVGAWQANVARYDKYTAAKAAFALKETLAEESGNARLRAEALVAQMNNEKLAEKARKALTDAGIRPSAVISARDLERGAVSGGSGAPSGLVDRLMGASGDSPLGQDDFTAALDRIYINDKALSEYVGGLVEDQPTLAGKKQAVDNILKDLLKQEFMPQEMPEDMRGTIFVTVRSRQGGYRPVTLHETIPEPLPEVEELSLLGRLWAGTEKAEENRKQREDYLKNRAERDAANKRNASCAEINEKARLYARAQSRQLLDKSERKTLADTGVAFPNEAFYRKTERLAERAARRQSAGRIRRNVAELEAPSRRGNGSRRTQESGHARTAGPHRENEGNVL